MTRDFHSGQPHQVALVVTQIEFTTPRRMNGRRARILFFVPSHKKSHPAIEPVNLDALRPCALCLSVWQRGAVLKCQLACTPVEVMAIKRWWIIINALWEMWCVITWQKSCAWCVGWETADGWVKWREAESKSEYKIRNKSKKIWEEK